MPKKLERCVNKVKENSPNVNPWAVCSKSTGYKVDKGSTKHKKKWVKENSFDSYVNELLEFYT